MRFSVSQMEVEIKYSVAPAFVHYAIIVSARQGRTLLGHNKGPAFLAL